MQRSFQPVMTTIVLTGAMLLACVPASASVLTLDDNNTHNLNSAVAQDDVEVRNSTTANLLAGGSIEWHLKAYNNSTVNMSGGSVGSELTARDASSATVSDGSIGGDLRAYVSSTLNVDSGSFGEDTYVTDNSTVNYYGGTFAGELQTSGSTTVNVYGGTFEGGLSALTESTVNVFGGSFGDGYLQVRSTLNIFGTDFGISAEECHPVGKQLSGSLHNHHATHSASRVIRGQECLKGNGLPEAIQFTRLSTASSRRSVVHRTAIGPALGICRAKQMNGETTT